ncbi:MAG: nucleotidyltransferase domain-containing protein [Minisyncoccales bacterium]
MAGIIDGKIAKISDKIVKNYKPKKIILFGSFAWGKPHKDSDADIFIIKDEDKPQIEMIRDVDRIIADRDMPVDILVYKSAQLEQRKKIGDPFILKIINSGKVLYER